MPRAAPPGVFNLNRSRGQGRPRTLAPWAVRWVCGSARGGRRTRRCRTTAIALFLERGFDGVSVAEVAAAAGISKPTLFRYFPAKEDLVLHRFADHEDEAARVVAAGRAEGLAPLPALHAHFRQGLDRRDPVTGLCDHPHVLAYHGLLYGTPSLVARLYGVPGPVGAGAGRRARRRARRAARGRPDQRRPADPRRGELAPDRGGGERAGAVPAGGARGGPGVRAAGGQGLGAEYGDG